MADLTKFPDPHHRIAVERQLGPLRLQVDLALQAPWTLLFGPSGSGKSSILRAACGLLGQQGVRFSRYSAASEEREETVFLAPERSVPAHLLGLGYAPQGGALFPHLSVRENIAFPLTVRGEPATVAAIDALLAMFEIEHLRTRRPAMLSGGERQRVNLARAFAVPNPQLLLLDEPFNGMGRELRNRLLARTVAWTAEHKVPVLSVSHDVDEALLADADVCVIEDGKIIRRGSATLALAAERKALLEALQS